MLQAMSWWKGDVIHLEKRDTKIVIRNMTQKQLQPMHTKMAYGDGVSRKT